MFVDRTLVYQILARLKPCPDTAHPMAYLDEFYRARGEKRKVKVLEQYATEIIGMAANVQLDEDYKKFDGTDRKGFRTTNQK